MLRHQTRFNAAALWVVACALGVDSSAQAGITLRWTAPGDDGNTGAAKRYDIRRSTQLLTEANFALADTVGGPPVPAVAGTTQSCAVALPVPGVHYYLAIKSEDDAGNRSGISNVVSVTAPVLGAGADTPIAIELSPPWPNPTRGETHFRLAAPRPLPVELDVYDAAGRRVRTLLRGSLGAGQHELSWNLRDDGGRPIRAGMFFVRAQLGDRIMCRRVVVVA